MFPTLLPDGVANSLSITTPMETSGREKRSVSAKKPQIANMKACSVTQPFGQEEGIVLATITNDTSPATTIHYLTTLQGPLSQLPHHTHTLQTAEPGHPPARLFCLLSATGGTWRCDNDGRWQGDWIGRWGGKAVL